VSNSIVDRGTVDLKRKDEIGELAESFSRMVTSLKFMMSDQEEK
jgi:HAMP domain-containing protein